MDIYNKGMELKKGFWSGSCWIRNILETRFRKNAYLDQSTGKKGNFKTFDPYPNFFRGSEPLPHFFLNGWNWIFIFPQGPDHDPEPHFSRLDLDRVYTEGHDASINYQVKASWARTQIIGPPTAQALEPKQEMVCSEERHR